MPFTETLGALAKAKRRGMTRHIGVSNFTLAMLEEAVRVCPEPLITNQIEYHAYLPQDRMLAALKRHGMILTAYCPVARGQLLDDPVIGEIAKAHGKTPAQICLRWLVQQPMVAAVPRALEEAHIEENLAVFDFALSDQEMQRISALRTPQRAHRRSARTRAQMGRGNGRVAARARRRFHSVKHRRREVGCELNAATYDTRDTKPAAATRASGGVNAQVVLGLLTRNATPGPSSGGCLGFPLANANVKDCRALARRRQRYPSPCPQSASAALDRGPVPSPHSAAPCTHQR